MKKYQLLLGDCREVLKTLPDNSVDSIVTDPPYELGFMGKAWDATGVAYDVNLWREAFRVLKHGGHILSFGGSRTYHRMACAIEDAGFEVRDQIMWVYGSGFPKSHNISKAFNKESGVAFNHQPATGVGFMKPDGENGYNPTKTKMVQAGESSDEAKQWDGWGTALKPAHEPICVARKPLEGTVVDNVRKWGVGGLNIDGCRVPTNPEVDDPRLGGNGTWKSDKMASNVYEGGYAGNEVGSSPKGRFPANLLHDGSQQVLDLFPESNGGAAPKKANTIKTLFQGGWNGIEREERIDFGSGSAARFFYCPKTSKKDRDEGCEDLPEVEAGLQLPRGKCPKCDAWRNASEKRCACGGEWEMTHNPLPKARNTHPTVKPTELMRYLCRLVTPPNGVVLDPFNGSGSTGKAAMLEGFRYIGIEKDPEYIKIAEARLKRATENNEQ